MKKKICLFSVLALWSILLLPLSALALDSGDIISNTAVLMDADTGQVLFSKDMDARVFPASTTKIMTAVVTLEHASPLETAVVSAQAIDIAEPSSSNIALREGEEISVDSALYALMLPSANDAANVLAEHVAGDQAAFADMMTQKAMEIGAVNTHFTNAHGLHDENHYTTAYDMALITRYAINNLRFMNYFGAEKYVMPSTNMQPLSRRFSNYQYMLIPTSRFYNPDVIGGKVGYTTPARNTMSTVAHRDGRTLIAVVMGSNRDDKFYDTQKLLDFGFDSFQTVHMDLDGMDSFEVPIHDADGREVGRSFFDSAGDYSFLIPVSANPDDVIREVHVPSAFAMNDDFVAEVQYSLRSAAATSPAFLVSIPVQGQSEIYGAAVTASLTVGDDAASAKLSFFSPAFFLLFLICFAASLLILSALSRIIRIQRRKRDRMRRLGFSASAKRARH